jgi:hypothetical protein
MTVQLRKIELANTAIGTFAKIFTISYNLPVGKEFSEVDYSNEGENPPRRAGADESGGQIDSHLYRGILGHMLETTKNGRDLQAIDRVPFWERANGVDSVIGKNRSLYSSEEYLGIDLYSEAALKGRQLSDAEVSIAEADIQVLKPKDNYANFSLRMGSEGNVHYNLKIFLSTPEKDEDLRKKVMEWGVPATVFEDGPDFDRATQGMLDDEHAYRFYNTLTHFGSEKEDDEK